MLSPRRALMKEVGGRAELEHALNDESGWKGRARQIIMLKARVKQLEGQLSNGDRVSERANMRLVVFCTDFSTLRGPFDHMRLGKGPQRVQLSIPADFVVSMGHFACFRDTMAVISIAAFSMHHPWLRSTGRGIRHTRDAPILLMTLIRRRW